MATDFAVYYLTRPLALWVFLAVLLGPLVILRFVCLSSFKAIGFRRLLAGHAAVAVAVFAMCAFSAYQIGSTKVGLAHIQREDLYPWVTGNSIYLFVLAYAFTVVFASVVLVPCAIWLATKARAGIASFVLVGLTVALGLCALAVAFPTNDWGRSHRLALLWSALTSAGVGAFIVCVAFGFGAGFPFVSRSTRNAT